MNRLSSDSLSQRARLKLLALFSATLPACIILVHLANGNGAPDGLANQSVNDANSPAEQTNPMLEKKLKDLYGVNTELEGSRLGVPAGNEPDATGGKAVHRASRVTSRSLQGAGNVAGADDTTPSVGIAAGWSHTFVILREGFLFGWGENFDGQLGISGANPQTVPALFGPDADWQKISTNARQWASPIAEIHTVAIKRDGSLWAWGNNGFGELGDGTQVDRNSPVQIAAGAFWIDVAAGSAHTAAIKADGSLWTWGWNYSSPKQAGKEMDWISVAAGARHTVALKRDGSLWAWGPNENGQLGDGESIPRDEPVQVGTDTDWAEVTAGGNHTVAIKKDGTLWTWGGNWYGQLSAGSSANRNVPVQLEAGSKWSQAAAGNNHMLAVKSDGSLWAWGSHRDGQLGIGDPVDSLPARVGTDTDWVNVGAGFAHSVASKRDGTVWAWGLNDKGQLGIGSPPRSVRVPVQTLLHTIIAGPPMIIQQPVGSIAELGETIEFQVKALGAGPLKYQWLANGNPLPNESEPVLRLDQVDSSHAGSYQVVVSNAQGRVESQILDLTVTGAPPDGDTPEEEPSQILTDCNETSLINAVSQGGHITFGCDGTITLNRTIFILKDTVLDGSSSSVTISGNGRVRVFHVQQGVQLTLMNLTVSGGASERGGAIFNNGGDLRLSGCVFSNNRASAETAAGQLPNSGMGGAIYSIGSLTITDSWFENNVALGGNGGHGMGGGIHIESGTAEMDLVRAVSNEAAGGTGGGDGLGGWLCVTDGSVTVSACTGSQNRAIGGTGRAASQSGASSGEKGGRGGNAEGGWIYFEAGSILIENSAALENRTAGAGGGRGGSGASGTGVTAGGQGGAGGTARGGAIFHAGSLVLRNTTIYRNTCIGGQGANGGRGGSTIDSSRGGGGGNGGDAEGGALFTSSQAEIANCTLFENRVSPGPGGIGGGGEPCCGRALDFFQGNAGSPGTASGGNIATDRAGAIIVLVNTILSHHQESDNCFGTMIDGGHNISSDASCDFSRADSLNNTDPLLGSLTDNGGPTLTMALLPGSPALDAAKASECPGTDQRGVERPRGSGCDIGAVELSILLPTVELSVSPDAVGAGGTSTATLTIGNPNSNRALSGIEATVHLPPGVLVTGDMETISDCNAPVLVSGEKFGVDLSISNLELAPNGSCRAEITLITSEPGLHSLVARATSEATGSRASVQTIPLKTTGAVVVFGGMAQPLPDEGIGGMVKLHAVLLPNGTESSAYFEYGPSATYGDRTEELPVTGGFDSVRITQTVNRPVDEPFHYRVVVMDEAGLTPGEDRIFSPVHGLTSCDEAELRSAVGRGGTIRLGCDGTIPLTQTLVVSQDTLIDATGHSVTISGSDAVRVFQVEEGIELTLINVNLVDGKSNEGAGIYNDGGSVQLVDCSLSGNRAVGASSGLESTDNENGKGREGARGGAIYCRGILYSAGTTFSMNSATGSMGEIGGDSGDGGNALGGAIYLEDGEALFTESRADENRATGGNGSPIDAAPGQGGVGGSGFGGFVYVDQGRVRIHATALDSNSARGGVGGAGVWSPRDGFAGVDGEGFGGGGGHGLGGAVYISRGHGMVTASLARKNGAYGGDGALFARGGGAGAGGTGAGGAIYSQNVLSVVNSTFHENVAGGGDGATGSRGESNFIILNRGFAGGDGGLAAGGGICSRRGHVSLLNVTLFDNSTVGGQPGSGGDGGFGATLRVGARGPDGHAGPSLGTEVTNDGGHIVEINTIVANSRSADSVSGAVTDGGNNLCSDASANLTAVSSLNNTNPKLGLLANYGGLTLSIAPLPDSPVISAADDAVCPDFDQRGVARPFGPGCDIGAVEFSSLPVFTVEPQSAVVLRGEDVTFRAAAIGAEPIRYQWKKNGQDLPGETLPTLTLTAVTESDAGRYDVVVSNAGGSVTSSQSTLTVLLYPIITVQPEDQLGIMFGANAIFSVTATGPPPLSYEWFKDRVTIPGAESAMLVLTNIKESDAGDYTVRVSNAAGSVVSSQATLTIVGIAARTPEITVHPQSQSVEQGEPATLMVTATGSPPLSYQWFRDGFEIPGSNTSTFLLTSASKPAAGNYSVRVSNAFGSVMSSIATLTVLGPPLILAQTQSQTVPEGGSVTFAVRISGISPVRLQWFKNGAAIPGAEGNRLRLTNVKEVDAGEYFVRISDAVGTVDSQSVTLTVSEPDRPPTISNIPNQAVFENERILVRFTVGDGETLASELRAFIASSNQTLVPDVNITLSGRGADRTVTVTPFPGRTGQTTITVTVNDTSGNSTSESFLITVAPPQPFRIVSLTRFPDGQVRLLIFGEFGTRLTIEQSSDFRTWTELDSVIGMGEPIGVLDSEARNHAFRFYRVSAP